MQLTTLLLVIVAILTALSGIAVISGAHKGDRTQAFLFFFTTNQIIINLLINHNKIKGEEYE